MLDSELKSKINLLWNKFWSGGISNPLQAIEQMSFLIFMKQLEDQDVSRDQNAKLLGKQYDSIFKNIEDHKWSVWTEYAAEQMLEHVRDIVFPFLRKLNGGENSIYSKYRTFQFSASNNSIPHSLENLLDKFFYEEDLHLKDVAGHALYRQD